MPRITKDNPLTNYISREEIARIHNSVDRSIAQGREQRMRLATLEALAKGVSNANLERIAKQFPNLLPEAVRELNGEVEYIQHNLTK